MRSSGMNFLPSFDALIDGRPRRFNARLVAGHAGTKKWPPRTGARFFFTRVETQQRERVRDTVVPFGSVSRTVTVRQPSRRTSRSRQPR